MDPERETAHRPEVARITLSVLFIGALIGGALWILQPFLGAFIWATMIVVATWPVMLRVEHALWGRRSLAVFVMVAALLAILIGPLSLAFSTILSHVDDIAGLAGALANLRLPPAPEWVAGLPVIGARAAAEWDSFAQASSAELVQRATPYAKAVAAWFARQAGSLTLTVVQFLLVAILAAILYAGGEAWAAWARRFGRRLAFEQGDRIVVLAGQAIRGVAMGVVVTAVLQSMLGRLGLVIAGVPFTAVLTAIMFVLCIAQVGPILVLLAATVWVYLNAGLGWGVFLLVWSLVVGTMDNFIRPILIKKGADLPLLLIFAGVIGGLIAFGLIGIFVGPVVLAVAYTLIDNWVSVGPRGANGPVGTAAVKSATLPPGIARPPDSDRG